MKDLDKLFSLWRIRNQKVKPKNQKFILKKKNENTKHNKKSKKGLKKWMQI